MKSNTEAINVVVGNDEEVIYSNLRAGDMIINIDDGSISILNIDLLHTGETLNELVAEGSVTLSDKPGLTGEKGEAGADGVDGAPGADGEQGIPGSIDSPIGSELVIDGTTGPARVRFTNDDGTNNYIQGDGFNGTGGKLWSMGRLTSDSNKVTIWNNIEEDDTYMSLHPTGDILFGSANKAEVYLTLKSGKAPSSPHAPVEAEDLVRKDYVDTVIAELLARIEALESGL